MTTLIALGAGLFVLGAVLGWLSHALRASGRRARTESALSAAQAQVEAREREARTVRETLVSTEARLEEARRKQAEASEQLAALRAAQEREARAAEEKIALLEQARDRMTDAFKAISADLLKENSASFLQLAQTSFEKLQAGAKGELEQRQLAFSELVAPVKESLGKIDSQMTELEKSREGAYQALRAQVGTLIESERALREEAMRLASSLKNPAARGRWGELQLRRVVELAGLVARCDFFEQETAHSEGGAQRPDMVVRLPAGKSVVVDAKVPLSAYLEAVEISDPESRRAKLIEHAKQIRAHIQALSRKAYWEQFQPTPELVVLFLPGEAFFSAALEVDPALLEAGAEKNVVLASPTTLIMMLRAVAAGWREESTARSAQEIRDLGAELYKRLSTLGEQLAKLGKSLGGSVDAFNRVVGTVETRLMVTGRKLEALEVSPPGAELVELTPVEASVRPLRARELVERELLTEPAARMSG